MALDRIKAAALLGHMARQTELAHDGPMRDPGGEAALLDQLLRQVGALDVALEGLGSPRRMDEVVEAVREAKGRVGKASEEFFCSLRRGVVGGDAREALESLRAMDLAYARAQDLCSDIAHLLDGPLRDELAGLDDGQTAQVAWELSERLAATRLQARGALGAA